MSINKCWLADYSEAASEPSSEYVSPPTDAVPFNQIKNPGTILIRLSFSAHFRRNYI